MPCLGFYDSRVVKKARVTFRARGESVSRRLGSTAQPSRNPLIAEPFLISDEDCRRIAKEKFANWQSRRGNLPLSIGLVDRFKHDQDFANLVTLCAGAFGNLALMVFNAVMWVIDPSSWTATLTVYFFALVIMSSLVAASTGDESKLPWRVVAWACGVMLVVLAIIVAVMMYICIDTMHNDVLPEIAMIALAAFTFYNAVVAIITATKTRKGDLRQQTLLRVSLAGVIGALLMLEMQMFGTYADLADPQLVVVMEAISGGVGAVLVLSMGCYLIFLQRKESAGSS